MTTECARCGKSVRRYIPHRRDGHRVFCSASCANEAQRLGFLRTCGFCGKPYYRKRNLSQDGPKGAGLYCSKLCRHTASIEERHCLTCDTVFPAYKTGVRQYCSVSCRPAWNKGKPWSPEVKAKLKASVGDRRGANNPHWDPTVTVRKCKTCKRVFRPKAIKRAKAGYGIYCSKTCYQKSKGESVPERLVREALNSLGELYQPQAVLGFFTVDFLLPFRTTVIEVDGNWWHNTPSAIRRDKAKTTYLTNRGFRVVRIGETAIRQDAIAAVKKVL